MASPGGAEDSGGSPASSAAPRAVIDDLREVRERAMMLRTILQGSTTLPSADGGTKELMDGMMNKLSSAMSALSPAEGSRGSGGRRRRGGAASGVGPQRRGSSYRRRSKSPFVKMITAKELKDGMSWRKYGQKHIHNSPNPRSYYRCTHKPDQGCKATRQVQVSESNPLEFDISYYGEHTCRDPSTIPFVVEAAPTVDCKNLISFRSASTSKTTGTSLPQRCHLMAQAVQYPMLSSSSPLPITACTSEETLSSGSPAAGAQLSALVGSAAWTPSSIVGSAPAEYWPPEDVAGRDMGSFPSSPSSLGGFMTDSSLFGFLGGADDDDNLFRLDP